MTFGSVLNLSSLNGSNGFAINGINEDDKSGYSVSSTGDFNGDGRDDLIIGAPRAGINGNAVGRSYVVFGSTNPFASSFNLSSLNGSNGFTISGINPGDSSGYSVSNAGDFNGDGRDDLMIGATGASPNGLASGQSYVVFGSSNSFGASFNLSSLNGSNGFALNGINAGDHTSNALSNAGDINGDGRNDLIIGARDAQANGKGTGQSYVVFGSSNSFGASFNLSSLNGSNGFAINGISGGDKVGRSVSAAGDFNGDGRDDLIIGADGTDPNGNKNSGQSYVVFGSTNPFAASISSSSLNGSNGFALNGIEAGDSSGYSVSGAGDFNGDGKDDLIIGAPKAGINGNGLGRAYVVFGSTNPFASSFSLASLNGSNGFTINGIGADHNAGISVSTAGDVNGDGRNDLIIGTTGADPNGRYDSGQSYVLFGSTNSFASSFNLSSVNGTNGFTINGIAADDFSGEPVKNGGDFNDDGTNDLIVAARRASPDGKASAGQTYIIFGQPSIIQGDNNNNLLNGTNGNDTILGLGGNDSLNGLLGNDTLDGGTDNDSLNGGIGNDSLTGGTGNDLYVVDNLADIVKETSTISTEIDKVRSNLGYTLGTNLENLTLIGTANLNGVGNNLNNLITGNTGNNLLDGTGGKDTLDGGSGNDTLNGGTGNDSLIGGIGNDLYLVDNPLDVVQENSTIATEIDTVQTNITYVLSGNIENLTLTLASNVQGTGNNRNNQIIGNTGNNLLDGSGGKDTLDGGSGNDTLNGGTGNDSLTGGNGNDTYLVDNTTDVVQETSTITTEVDTVQTNVSYTLGSNLETLIFTGVSSAQGRGNNLNNTITGNNGNNTLNGDAGNDTLNGGVGNDAFDFSTGVPFVASAIGVDTISDFTINSDKIVLSKTTFTAISSNAGTGFSNISDFAIVTTLAQAETSTADIVYNINSDRLFYNQNGAAGGFGTGGAFAAFAGNPNLGATDFIIIA